MKTCVGIPRMYIPRKEFEKWSVIACDQFTSDREYWKRVERKVGGAPSTLRFILPEAFLGEDDEERIAEIHANMYEALEEEWMEKLVRGLILTERTTSSGIRRGIVATIDLEAYTSARGESSPIRASEAVVEERLPARVALRRGAPLEFPHALLFYRDPKEKVMRILRDEELERLYDYDLMEDGGHLSGYFIPEYLAIDVIHAMHTRGEPAFAVADGNHSVAAAKAYWEELKPTLSKSELSSHPARFMLVELVNLYDDSIVFHPIHRLVTGVDREAFASFFAKAVKCRREGALLLPAFSSAAAGVAKTDELIARFLQAETGKVDYIHGRKTLAALAERDEGIGIVMPTLDKDDFFPQLKGGNVFPKKTFSVGKDREKRYYTEGREISYD